MPAPSHRTPLPLTIISGYLGAGKTTLVNHLLRQADGRKLVVLVNDFGSLPIDADLIESQDGDTLNLANGCACCSMGGDLFNALVDVLDRTPAPDHLIIEASGVADPARIANIALAEPDLTLDATVSLVDALTITQRLDDSLIAQSVTQQIAAADLLLINKLDLVDDLCRDGLSARLKSISPTAHQIETVHANVPIDLLIGLNLGEHATAKPLTTHDHSNEYSKWSFTLDGPIDRNRLEAALDQLPQTTLRLKGIVYFGSERRAHSVQCVASRWRIAPIDQALNESMKISRLVAIGLKDHLDSSQLDQLFKPVSGTTIDTALVKP